ncbi:hypothetical protein Glove_266g10 [Diversispora epigaea]|uniref:Uncharacterized protein n=1 Tax=Diversispora epigaea TaxID=1348612 RepID=A0A397I6Q2_9GLOM|nr:hypothetical protein Glove_266g10 [Diversispora epigaea]
MELIILTSMFEQRRRIRQERTYSIWSPSPGKKLLRAVVIKVITPKKNLDHDVNRKDLINVDEKSYGGALLADEGSAMIAHGTRRKVQVICSEIGRSNKRCRTSYLRPIRIAELMAKVGLTIEKIEPFHHLPSAHFRIEEEEELPKQSGNSTQAVWPTYMQVYHPCQLMVEVGESTQVLDGG